MLDALLSSYHFFRIDAPNSKSVMTEFRFVEFDVCVTLWRPSHKAIGHGAWNNRERIISCDHVMNLHFSAPFYAPIDSIKSAQCHCKSNDCWINNDILRTNSPLCRTERKKRKEKLINISLYDFQPFHFGSFDDDLHKGTGNVSQWMMATMPVLCCWHIESILSTGNIERKQTMLFLANVFFPFSWNARISSSWKVHLIHKINVSSRNTSGRSQA